MAQDVHFASLMASLRAPRVAVLVSDQDWVHFARRGVELLSRTWGGAGGVVVPVKGGQLDPAVARLLRRYDPDYLTTLEITVDDREMLTPGWPIVVEGKRLRGRARADFVAQLKEHNPHHLFGRVLGGDVLDEIAGDLSTFIVYEKHQRFEVVHPTGDLPRELSPVVSDRQDQVLLETGDPFIDLAIALQNGLPSGAAETRHVADGSLSRSEVCALLMRDRAFQIGSPFNATRQGLSSISYGFMRHMSPVFVFGQSRDDMALAMLWDRITGSGTWLPFTGRHKTWHPRLAYALDWGRRAADRKFVITSVSWSEERCLDFARRLWAVRLAGGLGETDEPWRYVHPEALDNSGRVDLRLDDRWDERFAAPVNITADGSAEMATTFPLLASEDIAASPRGWIVEVEWPDHPIHSHPAVQGSDLIASTQDKYETFVRASGSGISFESGRFDFVAAGASKYGQLAQPRLRWPGLLNSLRIVAGSSGHRLQPSYAGRTGRLATELWGGRERLGDDLAGHHRVLMDALVTAKRDNGPIDSGSDVSNENNRLLISGTCAVPLAAFQRFAGSGMDVGEIRSWLDRLVEAGAIRMGLVLGCGVCPWLDFYRVDEVGTHFECKRCGSRNPLAQGRWRDPVAEPRWYYSLHPTVVQFLRENGDVPVLAVRYFAASERARDVEFEIEILEEDKTKPKVEIDFAFMSRSGLVLGEAKSVGKLDGNSKKERVRDASKLIDAAHILGAREICFATTKTWSSEARSAIDAAVTRSRTAVTISVLEQLGPHAPSARTVTHNPSGP